MKETKVTKVGWGTISNPRLAPRGRAGVCDVPGTKTPHLPQIWATRQHGRFQGIHSLGRAATATEDVGSDFESQVSAQKKGANPGAPGEKLSLQAIELSFNEHVKTGQNYCCGSFFNSHA
jgi:hypothetical protein